jgi:hypothetical protein
MLIALRRLGPGDPIERLLMRAEEAQA